MTTSSHPIRMTGDDDNDTGRLPSTSVTRPLTSILPLPFHRAIVTELLAEDSALIVLARGLGSSLIIRFFIHSFACPTTLVFILDAGKSSAPDASLLDDLPPGTNRNFVHIVTADIPSSSRHPAYLKGGVFLITARILVVDLLQKKVPLHLITGILVQNAERVNETTTEAFCLRLLRLENQVAFIRAFTEAPEALVRGFSRLEKIMTALQVRKLLVWPRFHITVAESLSPHPVDTVEVHVNMTANMYLAQLAIMELLTACIAELRPLMPQMSFESLDGGLGVQSTDDTIATNSKDNIRRRKKRRTIENASKTLSEAFVNHGAQAIGIGSCPSGRKARNLWHDLHLLRSLLNALTEFDAISFLSFLEAIYASYAPGTGSIFSQHECNWILTEAADQLLTISRDRVYSTNNSTNSSTPSNPLLHQIKIECGLQATLEIFPKWRVLRDILKEVSLLPTYSIRGSTQNENYVNNIASESSHSLLRTRILILCRENKTSRQLTRFLTQGDNLIIKDVHNYLIWSKKLKSLTKSSNSITGSAVIGQGSKGVSTPVIPGSLAAKRRRIRTTPNSMRPTPLNSSNCLDQKSLSVEVGEKVLVGTIDENCPSEEPVVDEKDNNEPITSEDQYQDCDIFIRVPTDSNSDEMLIPNLRPDVIILYDAMATMVRRIEIYQAAYCPNVHLRTYFLTYKDSVEEQKYLASIRREREAFERVIKSYASVAIPLTMALPPSASSVSKTYDDMYLTSNMNLMNTENNSLGEPKSLRDANKVNNNIRTVIIDVREFRAALPGALHMRGMHIIPCTLEVGDYVVAPDVVIERKSYSDLVQSLANGRLYTQVSAMCQYYPIAVILIEVFDRESLSLSLFQNVDNGFDSAIMNSSKVLQSAQESIAAKMVLLTIHFPRIRLLWSCTPTMSAEMIDDLKYGRLEPQPEQAKIFGSDNTGRDSLVQTILRALPGVDASSERGLIENYSTLSKVISAAAMGSSESGSSFHHILGGTRRAQQLTRFVTATSGTSLDA